jgi:hypothetical protein
MSEEVIASGEAGRLPARDPIAAAEKAVAALNSAPAQPNASTVLCAAQHLATRNQAVLEALEHLSRKRPRSAPVRLELTVARERAACAKAGLEALRCATRLAPESPADWRALADHLDAISDADAADRARARYLEPESNGPVLLNRDRAPAHAPHPAHVHSRDRASAHPSDVAALRTLADMVQFLRRYADARELLDDIPSSGKPTSLMNERVV